MRRSMNEDNQNQNREKILAFIGLIAILVLVIYLGYRLLEFISSVPGYSFDPVNFVALLILTKLLWDNQKKQNSITEIQTHLLNNLIKAQAVVDTPKNPIKKPMAITQRQNTSKVVTYKAKRGRPRKLK
jgi:hypothetical protein